MRSLLTRAHYYSAELFETEVARVFHRVWILAAIRPMLATHLDFRTLEIGGIPIILQNFNGRIRAFANICRHRFSRIHKEEFGHRALVCPYHHWAYDELGQLVGVPRNAALFQFTSNQLDEIKLREFSVEVVGSLIFINLSDKPIALTDQFDSGMLEMLESTTSHMDCEFVYTRFAAAFNWKAGMENIKDPLHVQCLHRGSFPENFNTNIGGDEVRPVDHAARGWRAISLQQASVRWDVPIEIPLNHDWYGLVERLSTKGIYCGLHLFPNVNLMIVDGASFAIQIYNPLAAARTELQMMVALTRPKESFEYKPVVLWEHLCSDMSVLAEDIHCLEALQPGFAASDADVIHGAYEVGIMDFHSAYLELMRER